MEAHALRPGMDELGNRTAFGSGSKTVRAYLKTVSEVRRRASVVGFKNRY
jgi:hypothetical protein